MDGAAQVTQLSFSQLALSARLHLPYKRPPMNSPSLVGSGVAQWVLDPPSLLLLPLLSLEMLQEHVSWRSTWELCFTSALGETYHLPW